MSSPCELIIYEKRKEKADFVAQEIVKEAKRLEKKYSYYNINSYLTKINKRETQEIDFETKTLLQRAKQYYKLTNGVFDITIATIKDLFLKTDSIKDLYQKKESLIKYIGCEHFEIKKNKIIFNNQFTKIDLGGFVKEYGVDRAAKIIQKYKINSALINFGGDIFVVGKKPNKEKFVVGIKDPNDKTKHIQFVKLENEALTTSASYERNYKIEDQIFSHIISKQTKSHNILSASVISSNCVESGVYSTSLMIDPTIKCKNRTILIKK